MSAQLKSPKEMAAASVQWFVSLVLIALAVRFVFRLFGAEAGSDGFVSWLYETTGVLLEPVRGVFPATEVGSRYVLEFVTLFAGVAYMVVGVVAMGVVERWAPKRK